MIDTSFFMHHKHGGTDFISSARRQTNSLDCVIFELVRTQKKELWCMKLLSMENIKRKDPFSL